MNVQDYKIAGYPISQQISQDVIDRAESDVQAAYITPLVRNATVDCDVEAREALMACACYLVMQRSIVATRAGGKEKQTAQSTHADRWALLEQWSGACRVRLQALAEKVGVCSVRSLIDDRLCGFYFSTLYLGM